MTWGFAAQRRADEFDALVEGTSTRELRDARDAELLGLVTALRGMPQVAPPPEFVADLRERLMTEAASVLVPADPADLDRLRLPARHPKRERRLAAVAGGLAIVGATTSIAVASQSALPGDSLYPIKRAIESAHTGISVGEDAKGASMLANASDRLHEAEALTRQDDLGDDLRVAETLGTFTDQATEGSDLLLSDYARTGRESSIARLRDFASSSMDRLAAMEPDVTPDAHDELVRAAAVLVQIDAEAAQRCATCGGTPIESIPPVLAAAETITLPVLPPLEPTATAPNAGTNAPGGKHHDGSDHAAGGPAGDDQAGVPDVDAGDLPPGSVTEPSTGPGDDTSGSSDDDSSTGDSGDDNPVQTLTDGLTGVLTGGGHGGRSGGGGDDQPSDDPSAPALDDVVSGVTGTLEGVTDPLLGGGS